jgi:Cu+-exporting ATPase
LLITFVLVLSVRSSQCGACVASIESQLSQQDGILSVEVSLLAERAVVTYSGSSHWTPAAIAEEVDDIGFEAEVVERGGDEEIVLSVHGLVKDQDDTPSRRQAGWATGAMAGLLPRPGSSGRRSPSSPVGSSRNEDTEQTIKNLSTALEALPGVTGVTFPPPYTEIAFTHSPSLMTLRMIIDSLATSFPHLTFLPISSLHDGNSQLASLQKLHETAKWRRTFRLSACFAVPVFVVTMGPMWLPSWLMGWTMIKFLGIRGLYWGDVIALGLTIPVQGWLAKGFYRNAIKSLKHGSATM